MSFLPLIIVLFTAVLVVVCILLVFLILAQLPKKDAGAGLAFGGGTAEAIFGAGASTPLAQITKYCAGIFLGLALTLSALSAYLGKEDRLINQEAARQAAETTNEPAVAPGADSESSALEESNANPPNASTAEPLETPEETGSAPTPETTPPPQETPAESPNPSN